MYRQLQKLKVSLLKFLPPSASAVGGSGGAGCVFVGRKALLQRRRR
jgi:hypothetical protein